MKEKDTYQPSHDILKQKKKLDTSAPEGYFEQLAEQVIEQSVEVVPMRAKARRRRYISMAAASILLISALVVGRSMVDTSQAKEMVTISDTAVEDYLMADAEWLEEMYLEEMVSEEPSVELNFLLEDLDYESIEELYINEL